MKLTTFYDSWCYLTRRSTGSPSQGKLKCTVIINYWRSLTSDFISSTYQVRKLKLNWFSAAVSAFYGNFEISFRTVLFFVFFTNLCKLIIAGGNNTSSIYNQYSIVKIYFVEILGIRKRGEKSGLNLCISIANNKVSLP